MMVDWEKEFRKIRGTVHKLFYPSPNYIIYDDDGHVVDLFYDDDDALKKFKCYQCTTNNRVVLYKRVE